MTDQQAEHHVVVDRTRPMDFEVYTVQRVIGYGDGVQAEQEFRPFYASVDADDRGSGPALFHLPARAARHVRGAAPGRGADQLHRQRGVPLAGRLRARRPTPRRSGSWRWRCWSPTATCRC